MHQLLLIDDLIEEECEYTPWDELIRESSDAIVALADSIAERRDTVFNAITALLMVQLRGASEQDVIKLIYGCGGHAYGNTIRRMLIYADLFEVDVEAWNLHDIENMQYDTIERDVKLVAGELYRWRTPTGWEYKKPVTTNAGYSCFCLLMKTIKAKFGFGDDPLPTLRKWRELVFEPLYNRGLNKQGAWHQSIFATQFRFGLSYSKAKTKWRELENPRQDAHSCSD